MDKIIIIIFDNRKKSFFLVSLKKFFPSTTTRLEIALTKVSIVLTVNDTARIIISTDKNSVLSFNRMEKNARSEFKENK